MSDGVAACEAMRVALANISGALCDAGGVVPDDAARYGEAVRAIAAERDALRALVARLRRAALAQEVPGECD